MHIRFAVFTACFQISVISSGWAQEASEPATVTADATIGLRGGFDSNPTDGLTAQGSAFLSQSAAIHYLRKAGDDEFQAALTTVDTFFDPRISPPNEALEVSFANALDLGGGFKLRTTLAGAHTQTWSRQEDDLLLRNRLDYDADQYRLFVSADGKLEGLNERNVIVQDSFLPTPENWAALSVLPGAAYKFKQGEAGVSVAATTIKFLETSDYLGLRRDQSRLQPNLFLNARFQASRWKHRCRRFWRIFRPAISTLSKPCSIRPK